MILQFFKHSKEGESCAMSHL